ncbi:MAG: hypothetical protein ABI158_13220 [Edaphobacter sp.]
MKGAACFGSALDWQTASTAADVFGAWPAFPSHGSVMRVDESRGWRVLHAARQPQRKVSDEHGPDGSAHIWATARRDEVEEVVEHKSVTTSLAFYRKYTEGLLRRYVCMSTEMGRAPSFLGKDLFRARVTNYVVQGFDDVVIFVHDVEQCLAKLGAEQYLFIERITLQEYTQTEVAGLTGLTARTLMRRYKEALDTLTRILLERDLLEPLIESQGAGSARRPVKNCTD